jgi:hypothetical protein
MQFGLQNKHENNDRIINITLKKLHNNVVENRKGIEKVRSVRMPPQNKEDS